MRSVQVLVFTFCLVSSGLAKPSAQLLAYQDSLGQYSFGYSAPGSARSEIRTLNGETRGAYSYVDDAGVIQTTQYTADGENGFRVAATNLPQAPLLAQDTQDIILARTGEPQEEEMKQNVSKIGENNIFLKGLQPSEKKTMELDDKIQLQSKEGENISEDAKRITKIDETENLEGKLKNSSEVESQVPSLENKSSEISKMSNNQIIPQMLKQSSIPVFRISQGNLLIDPSSIQGPINVEGPPIVPASTSLKINQETTKETEMPNTKELPAPMEEEAKPEDQPEEQPKEIIAPINIQSLNSEYPTLVRYTAIPTLHYIVYSNA